MARYQERRLLIVFSHHGSPTYSLAPQPRKKKVQLGFSTLD
jgi:hypothetical protein